MFSYASYGQRIEDLKVQIRLCSLEVNEKDASIFKYKEVLKKQHTEILNLKNIIHELKLQIVEKNTELDKLRLKEQQSTDPPAKMLKLAKKFEENKSKKEAIDLYNLLITLYPNSVEASDARTILRNIGKKK